MFASSSGINAIALVVTVEDSATIAAAAERVADTAAETRPFNLLTSRGTCICRARWAVLVSEYPFCSHGSRDLQSRHWITRACHEEARCTLCASINIMLFPCQRHFPHFWRAGSPAYGQFHSRKREAFPGKTHRMCVYGPWGRECTGYVMPNQARSHYNPRCNIGCWKSSCEFLIVKNQ